MLRIPLFRSGTLLLLLAGPWLVPRVLKAPQTAASSPRPSGSPGVSAAPRASASPHGVATPAARAFASAAGCQEELAAQRRLPRSAGVGRFATWNLHWFPDGKPGKSDVGADLSWLGCTLWWLDADVVAVQEVKDTDRARIALATLLAELNRISGARYVARLDDCGRRVPQHVGLLWNEARVRSSDVATLGALNPWGEPCANQLRPGLGARLTFPGGLDLVAVSGHFKSMSDARSLELRRTSFGALAGILKEAENKWHDPDLLLLGDLNTMGCEECSPPVSAETELRDAARQLGTELKLVPADARGSHFHEGKATLLDHAVASRRMRELGATTRSHVAGACDESGGASAGAIAKKTRRRLSDHCPLVLDLTDRDLD